MDFSSIPLWIQVHDLPIEYMSKENAKEIRALVGEVLDVDLTGDGKICMSMFRRDEKLTRKEPYGFGPWMKAELINKRTTRWVEFIVEAAQTLDEDGEGRSKALGQRDEVRNLHTLGDSENENRCDSSETQANKKGGKPVANSSSGGPNEVIDKSGLINLQFSSNPFTWSNRREGLANIKERLDRAFANDKGLSFLELLFKIYQLHHQTTHQLYSL
nr:hypothetical protein CFP56_55250 [Quercus suber]